MARNKDGSFKGKVAFVTGAGSGIGRAAALAFAREGGRPHAQQGRAPLALAYDAQTRGPVPIPPSDTDESSKSITAKRSQPFLCGSSRSRWRCG